MEKFPSFLRIGVLLLISSELFIPGRGHSNGKKRLITGTFKCRGVTRGFGAFDIRISSSFDSKKFSTISIFTE